MNRTKKLFLSVFPLALFLLPLGCGPTVIRGGPGTDNTTLDERALSTRLDRMDIQYLVDQNILALFASAFWKQEIEPAAGKRPVVTVLPIENRTAEHLEDGMDILLSSIETSLVNSGRLTVVSRERREQMVAELGMHKDAVFDPATAGVLGRQLGATYYVTGKLGAVTERLKKIRRNQYNLFIQVLDVETSTVKFQHEAVRSKAMKR